MESSWAIFVETFWGHKKLTAVINIVKKGHVPLLRLNGRDYLIEQKST